jgi:hypothetical protein
MAENPYRRFPFAIRRWNTERQRGVMHALIVNAHPEQLLELEAITMRAANTMGPLGVNAISPSRNLFGGILAQQPQEPTVAQRIAQLARERMHETLRQMREVLERTLVGGILGVCASRLPRQ